MSDSVNEPTCQDIFDDPARIRDLPLTMLAKFSQQAKAGQEFWKEVAELCLDEAARQVTADIKAAMADKPDLCGTAKIDKGDIVLEVSVSKKVEWDAAGLKLAATKLKESGHNPSELIDVTYGVKEKAYSAWPSNIRDIIKPARTVKVGEPKVKFLPKDA